MKRHSTPSAAKRKELAGIAVMGLSHIGLARHFGLTLAQIMPGVRMAGYQCDDAQLLQALALLIGKELVSLSGDRWVICPVLDSSPQTHALARRLAMDEVYKTGDFDAVKCHAQAVVIRNQLFAYEGVLCEIAGGEKGDWAAFSARHKAFVRNCRAL